MRPFPSICPNWPIWLVTLWLVTPLPAQAQSGVYYESPAADTTRGYWRLRTDYDSRLTHISFYTAQHELLYQENLTDQYLKLTKRTVRQLDHLLATLGSHQLVADRVKSYELLVTHPWLARPRPAEETVPPSVVPLVSTNPFSVHLNSLTDSKLLLSMYNPHQQRLLITLTDDSFHYVHKEDSALPALAKRFDVSRLASGRYRFEVSNGPLSVCYELIIPDRSGPLGLHRVTPPVQRTVPGEKDSFIP